MTRVLRMALIVMLVGAGARAEDEQRSVPSGETVPKTFEGAGEAFKDGGKQIGEGFEGVGRGMKDVFTGEESKDDFKDAAKMGPGFRDVGRGAAGTGRAIGEGVKESFEGEDKQ